MEDVLDCCIIHSRRIFDLRCLYTLCKCSAQAYIMSILVGQAQNNLPLEVCIVLKWLQGLGWAQDHQW